MNIFKVLFGSRKKQAEENHDEPKDFDTLKAEGIAAVSGKRYAEAVDTLNNALRINPSDTECRDNLSQAYLALGDNDAAYEQLKHIVEEQPRNVEMLQRIAELAGKMHSFTAMADFCEKALLADSRNRHTYTLYGEACRRLGDDTNADAMYAMAAKLADSQGMQH